MRGTALAGYYDATSALHESRGEKQGYHGERYAWHSDKCPGEVILTRLGDEMKGIDTSSIVA